MVDADFPTLTGLVSQYSPSGLERGAVEWLVAHMKSLGFDKSFIDEVGNAVGIMGHGTKQIVLLGHIDTVPGEITVHVDNGSLYGRGSVDAKGPLACFVDSAAQVGTVNGWQFVVIGAVGEESDSKGTQFAANQYKPAFAIIGEPNHWDRFALGYKGSAWANVTIRCEQIHSASGEITACEYAVELWQKVKAYADKFNKDRERTFDKLLPTLRGMNSDSSDFEQKARLRIGMRLPPDVSPNDWYTKLNEILHNDSSQHGYQAELQPTGFAIPAWEGEKNTAPVRAFLSSIRSQGGEPRFVYKTGTADSNVVAPVWNCPVVVYGPGDSTLDHTPNEHIDLEEYSKGVHVLSNVLRKLTQ